MAEEIRKVISIEAPNGEKTIKGLRDEIKNLRDQLLNLDKDSKEYAETVEKLAQDQKELDDVMRAGKATFSAQKQELKELKAALENLEPGTEAYIQTFNRAAEITHNLSEQQQMLKLSANDLGTQLNNIRGIAQGMMGGISALNAAMGLMGKESEDVQKAMLKLQQGMAIVQGLQGMEGMMKKAKGLGIALKNATVGAKGLTGGIKALNAAIKANPIGLLISAIMLLIVYGKDLFGWITKLIGGSENLNAIWDKTTQVVVGLAHAIGNYLITPVRIAIEYFRTLGNVMKDVFTGNWSNIKNDVKNGIDAVKEDVVKGFSFMKNYREGFDKQMERNTKKRTEQEIKAQEELNKKKAELREKDLDNYIKDQEAINGQEWKWTQEGKKHYEELYKTRMSMYKKDSDEYRKAQRDMWSYAREYQKRIDDMKNGGSGSGGKKQPTQAEIAAAVFAQISEDYKQVGDYIDDADERAEDLLEKYTEIERIIDAYYAGMKEEGARIGANLESIEQTRLEVIEKAHQKYLSEYTKLMKETSDVKIEEIERITEARIEKIRSNLEKQELTDGIIIPDDLINQIEDIFNESKAMIETKMAIINKAIADATEQGLSKESEEYKLLDAEKEKLDAELTKLQIEHIKDVSDAVKQGYDIRLDKAEEYYSQMQKRMRIQQGDPSNNMYGLPQERELQMENDTYNLEKERISALVALYEEMKDDINLTFEERQVAATKYYESLIQLEDLELEHQVRNAQIESELAQKRIENYQKVGESIGNILGSVADAWESEINAQVEAGKMSEEEGKRAFERVKALQIAEAVIQTISGAISAFMSAQSLGFPWGTIVGAAQAAAVTAAGTAQIMKIKNTQFNSSSSSQGISAPVIAQNPTADFNNSVGGQNTNQNELHMLENAVTNGMAKTNMSVSVTEINNTQNRVSVREQEATW